MRLTFTLAVMPLPAHSPLSPAKLELGDGRAGGGRVRLREAGRSVEEGEGGREWKRKRGCRPFAG